MFGQFKGFFVLGLAACVLGAGLPAGAAVLQPNGSPTAGDPNLRLWLDANDAGTLFQDTAGVSPIQFSGQQVARWNDKSGNGLFVSEGSAARPDYLASAPALNGKPALYFNGDVLQAANSTGITGNANRTVITVWSDAVDYDANYQHTFHMGSAATDQAYGISVFRGAGSARIGNHYWAGGYDSLRNGSAAATVAFAMWDGAGGTAGNGLDRFVINGMPSGTNDRPPLNTGASQITIGSRLAPPSEGIRGNIAEVIVYDQVLTWEEQQALGGYLTQKYGLQALYGPQTIRYSTIADFDRSGPTRTGYSKFTWAYTPTVLSGGPSGQYMRLAPGAVVGTNPNIAFDQTANIADSAVFGDRPTVLIDFDFRLTPGSGQADGMALALLRTADFGSTGPVPGFNEDPNITSAGGPNFGVGFDIYNNGSPADPDNNHVSLHFGGLTGVADSAAIGFDISDGSFHHASIKLEYLAGGANVTMTLQPNSLGTAGLTGSPVTVFSNYFVPGLTPYAYRLALSGRTGGETADLDIDNVHVSNGATAFSFASDFRGRESLLSLTGNALFRDVGNMRRLTLTPSASGQLGSAWHVQKQLVRHGFLTDFQLEFGESPDTGADGMSFVVHNRTEGPTLVTGESGPGANALTISFDSYDNGPEPSAATIAVIAGGTELMRYDLAMLPFAISDLTNSGVHDVRVEYLPGALDLYFDGLKVIDGLNVNLGTIGALDPFGYAWVGFGGRTGGAWESHDVLNWHFAALGVPEPSTLVMLIMAPLAVAFAWRRKRRARP